ncbi:hypothetical protein I3760_01G038600 [Carya illinoinensis]|nr:hypothetical protein I3760_01G038600 [Carya illinoinensis]KAG2724877.1 hypothetical protein I3760_01G038600 [Carya illinoinensis]KAG2724878.1 hypothetical protein I3760_01G038600 [Carya illinoinensis]
MAKTRAWVALLFCVAVLWPGMCWCWGQNAMDDEKERMKAAAESSRVKAEEAKQGAAEAMHDSKDKMDSWVDWAYDKFNEGFGLGQNNAKEDVQNTMDKAGYAAWRATETMSSAGSDAPKYASKMAGDAKHFVSEEADQTIRMATDKVGEADETIAGAMEYGKKKGADAYEDASATLNMATETASNRAGDAQEKISEAMGYAKDKAADGYDGAKQKMNVASNMAWDKAQDGGEMMEEAMGYEKENAANAYDKAKHRVEDMYMTAKETMTEHAKTNYEAAKEKASQAAGDVGAKMRNIKGEL